LLRFGEDGMRDAAFQTVVGRRDLAAVGFEDDGRIVAAFDVDSDMGLMRFDADGEPDPSFGFNGEAIADFGSLDVRPLTIARALVRQSDGSFVLAGTWARPNANEGWNFALARFGETTGFPGLIGFVDQDPGLDESSPSVTLTVRRTGGSSGPASVSFETFDVTALAGSDYTARSGQLDWASGDMTERTIIISMVDDDSAESDVERFGVRLLAGGGATLATSSVQVSLFDDEPAQPPPGGGGAAATSSGGSSIGACWLVLLALGPAIRRRRRP
jgi:hypothetical protein